MDKCKKCKEVISLNLTDLLTGNNKAPKQISQENRRYCNECFKELRKQTA